MNIFVLPSYSEGVSLALLEAMAAGTPVMASDRSGVREVAGDAALLVDPENAEALGEALRDLTQSEDLRRDLARRGLVRARAPRSRRAVPAGRRVDPGHAASDGPTRLRDPAAPGRPPARADDPRMSPT